MDAIATLSLTDRLALTLGGLCKAVAARVAGGAMAVVMITLVWGRVRRVERQVLGLLARFRAGRLRVGGVAQARGAGRVRRKTGVKGLPRRFAWLLPLVPCEAANFASQVRVLLEEPEMAALLEAAPQARRVLGPLCRMLGVEIPGAPARVARESAGGRGVPARAKRVRRAMEPPPWRVPLPRGVMTAARRQGFGRIPRG